MITNLVATVAKATGPGSAPGPLSWGQSPPVPSSANIVDNPLAGSIGTATGK